jgi:hypothetical protein
VSFARLISRQEDIEMTLRCALAVLLAAPIFGADTILPTPGLVVHEWGTFPSVADSSGQSMRWLPLSAAPDLPCFVNRLHGANPKASLAGLVRMETPVIYFYTRKPIAVTAHADFPHGLITEWYPQAVVSPRTADSIPASGAQIEWRAEVTPGEALQLPSSKAASRYFAARETDAAPLRAGAQQEKMLFYRGVGDFSVPLAVRFESDGRLAIRNTSPDAVPMAMLFENRNGRMGFRTVHDLRAETRLETPELTGDAALLRQQLTGTLVTAGLYPKEAQAMVATWSDSWFEEGMRVFYVVPRSFVDSVLPLTLAPAPETVARVFVGRVELLSPALAKTLETALADGDTFTLGKYGRFLQPFAAMLEQRGTGKVESPLAKTFMDRRLGEALSAYYSPSCVK